MSVTVFGCAQGLLAVAVVHISPKKVNQIKSYDPATSFTDEGWARRGFQERPSKVGTAKKTHEAREGSGFRKNRIKSFASESFSILSSFTLYQAVSSKTAIWRCPWTTIWDVQKMTPLLSYIQYTGSQCANFLQNDTYSKTMQDITFLNHGSASAYGQCHSPTRDCQPRD